jgi:hypothetical protein
LLYCYYKITLYWYKSTNTDAKGAAEGVSALRHGLVYCSENMLACFTTDMLTYADVWQGVSALARGVLSLDYEPPNSVSLGTCVYIRIYTSIYIYTKRRALS